MSFSRLWSLDGNNSLKRMATVANRMTGDTRTLEDSTYWLPTSYVNRFANEVPGRKSKESDTRRRRVREATSNDEDEDEEDVDWEDVDELEGDPTDGVALVLLREGTERNEADDSSRHADTAAPPPASDSAAPAGNASDSTAPGGDTGVTDRVQATLLRKLLDQCVDNWKAAAAEAKKKMWKMYEESGVFASACRHGFILWLCDMMRSGEL